MSITRDLRKFNNTVYIGGDKGVLKKKIVDGNVIFEEVSGTVDQVHSLLVFNNGTEEFLLSAGLEGIRIVDKNDKVSNLWEVIVKGEMVYNPGYTRKIERSPFNNDIIYAGLERKIRVIRYENGKWYHLGDVKGDIQGKVHAIVEDSPGKLWVSTYDQEKLYIVDITSTDTLVSEYLGKELDNVVVNNVKHIAGEVFITSDRGIFKFNREDSLFVKQNWLMLEDKSGIIYHDLFSVGEYGYLVIAADYQDFDYLVAIDGSRIMEPFLLMPKSYTSGILYDNNEI